MSTLKDVLVADLQNYIATLHGDTTRRRAALSDPEADVYKNAAAIVEIGRDLMPVKTFLDLLKPDNASLDIVFGQFIGLTLTLAARKNPEAELFARAAISLHPILNGAQAYIMQGRAPEDALRQAKTDAELRNTETNAVSAEGTRCY
jgi:hypothetical protein